MNRLRVYIETSVWSFCFAEDVPDYTAATLAFFDSCRQGAFETYVSDVVVREIARAPGPLAEKLLSLVAGVRPVMLTLDKESEELSEAFLRLGAVPPSRPDDARHVAVAFAHGLDVLVSWNFRHLASVRRSDRFNAIAALCGYRSELRIVSPSEVLYEDQDA